MHNFGISPQKTQVLYKKMAELGISEDDIVETFTHASGKGGQNVNKVATCVRLLHLPTGIAIKSQKARTQALNRYYARQGLVEKIDFLKNGKKTEKALNSQKLKKQKKKRAKRHNLKDTQDNTGSF
jgi:protein subunit release factor B